MNVTVSTEQESCFSRTGDNRISNEQPRQESENECGMNDANVPILCNVVASNLSHSYECQSWIRTVRMIQIPDPRCKVEEASCLNEEQKNKLFALLVKYKSH
jgi:hypothetical protein